MSSHPRHPCGRTLFHRALLLTLLCISGTLLRAQITPSFSLEVLPESLELQSCQTPTPLFVVARNTGPQSIADLTLDPTTDPKITLTPDGTIPVGPLQKGDQRRWSYRVTCAGTFTPTALILTATARTSKTQGGLSQIILKSVPVKLRPPDAIDSIATVDIKSNLETLNQASVGDLLVAVTNKTTQSIRVEVRPQHSSSIAFSIPDGFNATGKADEKQQQPAQTSQPAPPTEILPTLDEEPLESRAIEGGETFTFPFIVKARQRVASGKQLLGINVAINDGKTHHFLVTRDVNVGVLGESEVLKLLGIPSLLFLPGFLVMTSFLSLWRTKPPPTADAPVTFSLTEKDPVYWVIAVPLSAAVLSVFVWHRSDFLALYGLLDIAYVWMASIILGGAAYGATWLYLYLRDRKKFPQADDSPQTVLRRLKSAKKKMELPIVTLNGPGTDVFVLAMQPDGSIFICPQMILTWYPKHDTSVKDEIDTQLVADGDPGTILDVLDRLAAQLPPLLYGDSGIQGLDWNNEDSYCTSPRKITRDLYTAKADRGIVMSSEDPPDDIDP